MLYGLRSRLLRYGIGLREFLLLLFKDFGKKFIRFLKFGLGQRRIIEGGTGGIMHGSLFYGFLMLLAYTTLIFIQTDILPLFTPVVFMQGSFYITLEFLGDVLGIVFIIGLVIAVYRRYVQRLEKLETKLDDHVVLTMLIWIGVSGFFVEAFRFLAQPSSWQTFSPVGSALSSFIGMFGAPILEVRYAYQAIWWMHMLSVFALIAITPYTKLIHVFTSGFNVALAPEKPLGRLDTPFNLAEMLKSGNFESPPNARTSRDFSPLKLLALDSCTNCGRCQEVCPAYAAGRDLSPRIVVQDLGKGMCDGAGDVFSGGLIREDELWSCTTCNACVSVCPVFINQVDYIIDFRRTLVAMNKLDSRKRAFLENVGRSNNPFGLPQGERQNWLIEIGVPTIKENPDAEYIYWIGCQASYDPRGRSIAKAMIKILRSARVNFAILGNDEICTGEPVRRMGEEARFQELAMKNIELIKSIGVKKVIVHCAHCFNTFLNEYPEFGSSFQVIHHSQLIEELISRGRIRSKKLGGRVTFHDPCNLGRINGVFETPRKVLESIDGLEVVEMRRNRMNSFCCGGGGANVWYQVPEKKKIGAIRMEEAKRTGANTLAVACPFCITMFEDVRSVDESIVVKDIAEIIAEGLG
jgi:Fe-S oxidoreductase/nitrate reductase gamma subunit